MNCMKCGKKTDGTSVFCAECLAEMERYPVRPGTVVHIPTRKETADRKVPRKKKERTPEEHLTMLHRLVQILVICVVGLATTLAVTLGVLVYVLVEPVESEPQQVPTGRNYSTSTPVDEE